MIDSMKSVLCAALMAATLLLEVAGWPLFVISIALALTVSPWLWVAAALAGSWKCGRWYYRNGRPWRRVHFNLMQGYARAAGRETGMAEREGREWDLEKALNYLAGMALPDLTEEERIAFVDSAMRRCRTFADESLLASEIRRRHRDASDLQIQQALHSARPAFVRGEPALRVRMVIAGVIERMFGDEQRAEYLLEVMRGRAP